MAQEKSSKFQLILLVVFGAFVILAVLIFSGAISVGKNSASTAGVPIVLWGSVSKATMTPLLDKINESNKAFRLSYQYVNQNNFDTELIEALASGKGPDLIFLPNDLVIRYSDKVYPIPYTNYPLKQFQDTFITEAELYLGSKGIFGLPITVDPLVLYYNQAMLDSSGIALPPKTWQEITSLIPTLTISDTSYNISQSTIALGEFNNISNAKEIISLLMMQFGTPIVVRSEDKLFSAVNDTALDGQFRPGPRALEFYTKFSNPAESAMYTWNAGMDNSRNTFIAGNSAFYIGYASELFYIKDRNPNLNFNVSLVPQLEGAKLKTTYGKMNSVAITKNSKNVGAAFAVATQLTSPQFAGVIASSMSLPPARRDLLSAPQSIPYVSVFYQSSLISKAWFDPSGPDTTTLFIDALRKIKSGAENADQVTNKLDTQFDILLNPIRI
jgi:ABC-type glycerol-3-phosphate transport system substrate-binding protein